MWEKGTALDRRRAVRRESSENVRTEQPLRRVVAEEGREEHRDRRQIAHTSGDMSGDAVRAATDLAQAWSVPEALVGVVVLAILTSLPNAWTGVRFGLQGRGSALMSETLNSNSINIVFGLAVPAALGALAAFSGLAIFDLAWLIAMTAAALVLFGKRGGGGRAAGTLLIALYLVFLAVQFAKLA